MCKNFELPEGYQLNLINPLLHNTNFDWDNLEGINRFVVPFMCCGDLSAFDSDKGDVLKVKLFFYFIFSKKLYLEIFYLFFSVP